jgi:Sulfotransferase domain
MMYGAKVVLKYMLGLDQAGRNFAVFPDDTLVVSYPRSGNTWTRFLIANLVHPEKTITFANIESLIPDTSSISSRALKRISRPRIIKSHDYFDHRYPKVIYIVRDPRDVALSYYDFQRKYRHIEDKHPLERYVDDFVNGRLISASWGTWAENVGSWMAARGHTENFLLLRFEDMLEDTQRELVRVAQFLNLAVTSETLERAIVNSAADRMRQMEKQEEGQWVATKKHRKDIPFVRVAKSGGWKTNLPAPCVMQIEAAWGELMSSLGYSLVSMSSPEERILDSTLSR